MLLKVKIESINRCWRRCPHDWLVELRELIKTLNPEAARHEISKIEKQNPELAEKLQGLIKNFRFDILNNLIEEIIQ